MKKIILGASAVVLFSVTGFSQTYNTSTVYLGNNNTIIQDNYGNRIGTMNSSTDYIGDVNTNVKDNNGNITDTYRTTTDYFGNTQTKRVNSYGY